MNNRETALELAMRVFESGTIEPYEIAQYAEKFVEFLDGPNQGNAGLHGLNPWNYFTDESNPHSETAYFRRIKNDDASTCQFLAPDRTSWSNAEYPGANRAYIEACGYREIWFDDLPNWVKEIS
jgi:hypothetical protein